MKWYWYVFFVLLILVGIDEYRISKFHLEIHQLKDKIKELQLAEGKSWDEILPEVQKMQRLK